MSKHYAKIIWKKSKEEQYTDNKYSRAHKWIFDGGAIINASASPDIVPFPYSVAENVDPEEAFIASIASCHMLFFLSITAKKKYIIDSYIDNPVGVMEKDIQGKPSITKITLQPLVKFIGNNKPSIAQINNIHQLSHRQCFIANSVKTQITIDIIT